MRVYILRSFTCARDGGSADLKPGDVFDVPDRLAASLMAGGYVCALPAKEDSANEAKAAPRANAPEGVADVAGRELHVRHVGRGKYAVFLGRERLTEDGLSQAEAEAALREMR